MVMLAQDSDALPEAMKVLLPAVGGVPRNLVALFRAAAKTCQKKSQSSGLDSLNCMALDVVGLGEWLSPCSDALWQDK